MILLIVIGAGAFLLLGGKKSGGRLLYVEDGALLMVDVKESKPKPEEITDSVFDNYDNHTIELVRFSKDEKYLFYAEDYDGRTFDLFKAPVSELDNAERIAAGIEDYTLFDDATLVYVKSGKLHYYDGNDDVKLGSSVQNYSYRTSEKGKSVCWGELDQQDGSYTFFWQDLAKNGEKVRLMKNISSTSDITASDDMSKFLIQKSDSIYQVNNKGEDERIVTDVENRISWSANTGEIYYTVRDSVETSYSDIIDFGTGLDRNEEIYVDGLDTFDLEYDSLYHYDSKGTVLVAAPCSVLGASTSKTGVCVYVPFPAPEELSIDWAYLKGERSMSVYDLPSFTGNAVFGAAVCQDDDLIPISVAVGGEVIGAYPDLCGRNGFCDFRYDRYADALYLFAGVESDDISLYKIPLTGSGKGTAETLDSGIENLQREVVTKDGIYYMRDYDIDDKTGDLYLNGRSVDTDVFDMRAAGNEGNVLIYGTDYDSRGQFTVNLYKNGEKTSVANDIYFASCDGDGTVAMLADYNENRSKGDLLYYNGRETKTISTDAQAVVPRSGSVFLQ